MWLAGSDLFCLVADADLDGSAEVVALRRYRQLVAFELDLKKRRPTKLHGERQPVQVPYRLRVEVEHPHRG